MERDLTGWISAANLHGISTNMDTWLMWDPKGLRGGGAGTGVLADWSEICGECGGRGRD